MTDDVLDLAGGLMGSPWLYLVLFLCAVLDGFLPLLPSEGMLLLAGAFAATGRPNVALVALVAASGAFVGDHICYLIGRRLGPPVLRRLRPGTKRHTAARWLSELLGRRGGVIVIIGRFLPGLRSITTLTAGVAAYPRRAFALFDAIGALMWGVSGAFLGYFAGTAFQDSPVKGLLVALVLVAVVITIGEIARYAQRRLRASGGGGDSPESQDTAAPAP
ncbi:DedA family protein [Streptosporangium sp. CA-135522]|uniref:DedA family protein n=1 Tax=Streptosporangium sp. CA-135522 TaxID=3240072 RepID=UPI003D941A49